jgi:hypothetical protein
MFDILYIEPTNGEAMPRTLRIIPQGAFGADVIEIRNSYAVSGSRVSCHEHRNALMHVRRIIRASPDEIFQIEDSIDKKTWTGVEFLNMYPS